MKIIDKGLQFNSNHSSMKKVEGIGLHHSGVTVLQSVEVIHNYHKSKGWAGIGYHYYVRKDGSIYRGRPENMAGAHCTGINSISIGICAEGNFSEETITKYHLFFIYDVREYLNTLDYLQALDGSLFIPAHCEAVKDISSLIELNRSKVKEIIEKIFNICKDDVTFEDVLKQVFDSYNLSLNTTQYVLIGSTIRSYLSYLFDEDRITYEFKDNKMVWHQK